MTKPAASVLITCYNKGILLNRAVESLLKQDTADFEIILVDDCSQDPETLACIAKIRREHPEIRYCRHPVNRGFSQAKMTGVEMSRSDLILLLDADDAFPYPDIVRRVTEVFHTHLEIDFICGNYFMNGKPKDCSVLATGDYIDNYKLARSWCLLGSSPFRKQMLKRVGGFNANYSNVDDMEFFRRAILAGSRGYYLNAVIYSWNIQSDSMSRGVSPRDRAKLFFRTIRFDYRFLPLPVFIKRLASYSVKLLCTRP